MNPSTICAARDDLLETLDRILDKGIVVGQFIRVSLERGVLLPEHVQNVRIESISIQAQGQHAIKLEDLGNLFPYWRRDLWSK